jgi:hypothetical protein
MKATFQIMKINDYFVKNYLVLFSRYLSDYYYFKHGMEYFMWNFYISSDKKARGCCMHVFLVVYKQLMFISAMVKIFS